MKVRKITGSERFDAYLISAYCFHSRIDDIESKREEAENEDLEDWGMFTEDGTLTARIVNNKYDFVIDGAPVKAGGIGAVSTLPEFRGQGAIQKIFKELLPEAYRSGEVISALYPFNQAFYRKMGYEVVTYQSNYELSPELLSGYRFHGTVKRWTPGESIDEYLQLYNSFAKNYNLSMLRDTKSMMEHMKVDKLFQERKFSYLLNLSGENVAYVTFTDIRHDPAAILSVEECAWLNRDGFQAILAFLGRFGSDYGTIQLPLPYGIDLLRIIQTPRSYDLNKTCRHDYMLRVINVKKLLEAIKKPSDCDFIIKVMDEMILENNCVLHVNANSVSLEADTKATDITVSVQALAQLAAGCINLDEAMLRPDVEITAKEDMLRRVFTEKKIFVGEHF